MKIFVNYKTEIIVHVLWVSRCLNTSSHRLQVLSFTTGLGSDIWNEVYILQKQKIRHLNWPSNPQLSIPLIPLQLPDQLFIQLPPLFNLQHSPRSSNNGRRSNCDYYFHHIAQWYIQWHAKVEWWSHTEVPSHWTDLYFTQPFSLFLFNKIRQ